MIINKALVRKGSTPLVQMFFSDVSTITMFQSLNALPGKSNDECFRIAENNSSRENKTKWRFFYLSQTEFWQRVFTFCSRCRCSNKFIIP